MFIRNDLMKQSSIYCQIDRSKIFNGYANRIKIVRSIEIENIGIIEYSLTQDYYDDLNEAFHICRSIRLYSDYVVPKLLASIDDGDVTVIKERGAFYILDNYYYIDSGPGQRTYCLMLSPYIDKYIGVFDELDFFMEMI